MRNIELTFQQKESGFSEWLGAHINGLAVSILLFAGFYLSIVSMFDLTYNLVWILLAGIGAILAGEFCGQKVRFALGIAIVVVLAAGLLLHLPVFSNGLKVVANQIAEVMGRHGNITYFQFPVSVGDNKTFFGSCFLIFCSMLLAFFCLLAEKGRRLIPTGILAGAVFGFQIWIGAKPVSAYNLILILGLLLLMGRKVLLNKDTVCISNAGMQKKKGLLLLPMLILFCGVVAVIQLISPEVSYKKDAVSEKVREWSAARIYDLRFEKGKPNSFTQGNFQTLSGLKLWEEPALDVTMSEPQSYYLRGFVGSSYTSTQWKALDPGKAYDEYAMRYWLGKSGFQILNQLSLLEQQGILTGTQSQVTVQVENVNANSRYLYLPYELSTSGDTFAHTVTDGDSQVRSTKWNGQRSYTFQTAENLTGNYSELVSRIQKMNSQNSSALAEFQKNELNYRDMIYSDDLELPGDISSLFGTLFGGRVSSQQLHVDYQEAISFVRDYLKKNMTYDINAGGVSDENDFVTEFLTTTKKGYSVHYATAATLMFRYMGIPSRYVEGYLITPKNIEGLKANETLHVQGMNGHAWTEIYEDGIGWIPIEVTPPYYGIMEQAQVPGGNIMPANGDSDNEEDQQGEAPETVQPPDQAEKLDQNHWSLAELLQLLRRFLPLLIIIAVVCVILIFILRRRSRVKKRELAFADPNTGEAICQMFAYLELLFAESGIKRIDASARSYVCDIETVYGAEFANEYLQILELAEKASFWNGEMTQEERQLVVDYKDRILQSFIGQLKKVRKIVLKYWKCLF